MAITNSRDSLPGINDHLKAITFTGDLCELEFTNGKSVVAHVTPKHAEEPKEPEESEESEEKANPEGIRFILGEMIVHDIHEKSPLRFYTFSVQGDNKVALYFNEGRSRIVVDDGCWVIQNYLPNPPDVSPDGSTRHKWKNSPWIFPEAKQILDELPTYPSNCEEYVALSQRLSEREMLCT